MKQSWNHRVPGSKHGGGRCCLTGDERESRKPIGVGDAMLFVDNVGKNHDCSELAETMASENTKEDEGLVPSMKMDTFTFQWVTWRREVYSQLGVSIDFDEENNLIQVIDVSEIGSA